MSIAQLQEDVATLKKGEVVCDEARELVIALQNEIGYTPEDGVEWNDDANNMNVEMMEGLMRCFDSAGLFWDCLSNKDVTSFVSSFASMELVSGSSLHRQRGDSGCPRLVDRSPLPCS